MDLQEDFLDCLVNLKQMIDLFGKKKIKDLKQKLEETQLALADCGEKLLEKQEHINKTNAYWKKKMREVEGKNSRSKHL